MIFSRLRDDTICSKKICPLQNNEQEPSILFLGPGLGNNTNTEPSMRDIMRI
jgi:hypothetical protein